MTTDTKKELEKIFLSYDKALQKLRTMNIKTKSNKEITSKDLRQAINIMDKKHALCRWKCQKYGNSKHYILIEGFYWLVYVYFQYKKSLIDSDIDFFITRIKQYEELLLIEPKAFWKDDMYVNELEDYFNKAHGTIKNNIIKMNSLTNCKYSYCEEERYKIKKEGIEWLCKNVFKQKYLEILEKYKMELTEEYIKVGYPYDIF